MKYEKYIEYLRLADRRERLNLGTKQLFKAVKFALLYIVIIATLDIVFHLTGMQRILLIIVSLFAGSIMVLLWLYKAYIQISRPRSIARSIEDENQKVGSSLINYLDLHEQMENGEMSERTKEINKEVLRQYGLSFKDFDFSKSLVKPGLKREFKLAALAIFIFILAMIPAYKVAWLEVLRFVDPFGDHPPFSFTKLHITNPLAGKAEVIFGDNLVIEAKSKGHHPEELFLSYFPKGNEEQMQTLPMYKKTEDLFAVQIENIEAALVFYVHTADKRARSEQHDCNVIFTPQLESAEIKVIPPAYTGLKYKLKPFQFNTVTALEGSTIEYTIHSNRPLKDGKIIYSSLKDKQELIMVSDGKSIKGSLEVTENSRQQFQMFDETGIMNAELLKGSIHMSVDQAPSIQIINPQGHSFITEDFVLEIKIDARDDYGIEDIRLHRAINGLYSPPLLFKPANKYERNYTAVSTIKLSHLGVLPGDIISLFADTTDNAPIPKTTITKMIHLNVVSVEEYNNYLRQKKSIEDAAGKYDQLQNKLADLIEEQKKLVKEIEDLKKQIADGNNSEATQEKLMELMKKQGEVASKLNKLANEFEKFGREQPLYDIEKEFAKELKGMADKIREASNDAKKQMGEMSQGMTNDALKKQGDELGKIAKELKQKLEDQALNYQEKIEEPMQDMSKMNKLVNDFNRFKYLYQLQTELTEKAKAYNVVRDLSLTDQRNMKKLASEQKYIQDELEQLQTDLWDHAGEASELFPKAASSAMRLAELIKEKRLEQLSADSVEAFLISDGPESYSRAEKLRQAMHEIFEEPCNSQSNQSCMSNELDQYLRMMLGMDPGKSFQQMSMCKKLGMGRGRGRGFGHGMGNGPSGNNTNVNGMGPMQPNINLLGNEPNQQEANPEAAGSGNQKVNDTKKGIDKEVKVGTKVQQAKEFRSQSGSEGVDGAQGNRKKQRLIEAYFEKITGEEHE